MTIKVIVHRSKRKVNDAADPSAVRGIQRELANIGQRLSGMSKDGSDDAKVLKQAEAFVDKAYDVLKKVL